MTNESLNIYKKKTNKENYPRYMGKDKIEAHFEGYRTIHDKFNKN